MKKTLKHVVSFALILTFMVSLFACRASKGKEKFTKTYIDYFDTVTTVVAYCETVDEFENISQLVSNRLSEYHKLYDIYNSYDSLVNIKSINALYNGVHKEFTVDRKIIDLLLYSKEMYNLTGGETNIAMGSVLSLWHEQREAAKKNPLSASLPDKDMLISASQHTDINNLIIDEEKNTVFILDPEMTLDVGAIAKGYATEVIAKELETMGVSGVTLNVGGNIRTIGEKREGEPWIVGVENPDLSSPDPYIEYVELSGESFVTSGSYQRYYSVGGKKYHHIIDKDTLYPLDNFTSVSVLTLDSAMADSLSTALFSMDYESGRELIESIDGAEAMWYTSSGEKLYSSGFSAFKK